MSYTDSREILHAACWQLQRSIDCVHLQHAWAAESRGSYAWDDPRYDDEPRSMLDNLERAVRNFSFLVQPEDLKALTPEERKEFTRASSVIGEALDRARAITAASALDTADRVSALNDILGDITEAIGRIMPPRSGLKETTLEARAAIARHREKLRTRALPAGTGIYVASKSRHGATWRELHGAGAPLVSSWIHESGPGESACLKDLWRRCIAEASSCEALVLYRSEGDEDMVGALMEAGAALAHGRPVIAVGFEGESFLSHPLVEAAPTIEDALDRAAHLLQWRNMSVAPDLAELGEHLRDAVRECLDEMDEDLSDRLI